MKKFRVKTLANVIAIVLVTVALGVIAISSITSRGITEATAAWRQHQDGSMRKARLLTKMRDALGYGGMIHELKNFVLRGDRPRIIRIHRKLRDFSVALVAFDRMAVRQLEVAAIRDLTGVLANYSAVAVLAERMAASSLTPAEIDKAIRVDDGPALAALEILDEQLSIEYRISTNQTARALRRVTTVSLIGTVGAALLLGGVIIMLFWFARTQLLRPMDNLNRVMRGLADGDYALPVPYLGAKNEIGEVAGAVQVFKESMIHIEQLEQERRRLEEERVSKSLSDQRELERQVNKRTEQLRQSEAHVREVVDSMRDGVITIDAAGVIETFNPAAEKIFGYGAQEIMGNNIKILMPVSYAIKHDDNLAKFMRTGSTGVNLQGRVVRGLRRNGEEFPMDISVVEIAQEGRRRFIGVVRDITRQLENVEKAQRLGGILEESPSAIFMVHAETGRYVDANASALNMTGYTLDELRELTPADLQRDDNPESIAERHQALQRGDADAFVHETVQYRKDGSAYPVEIRLNYSESTGEKILFTIVQDITARKAAERALLESRQRMAALLTAIPDLIFTVDGETEILDAWPAEGTGIPLDMEYHPGVRIDRSRPQDEADLFKSQLARAFQSGKIQLESYGLEIDGDARMRERRIIASGPNEAVVMIRDVTEERKKEEKIQRLGRILDESPSAVFLISAKTRLFTDANASALRMTGFTLDELARLSPMDIRPGLTDEIFAENLHDLRSGKVEMIEKVTEQQCKDGTTIPVELRVYYSDNAGDPMMFTVMQDITERKAAEKARNDTQLRLEAFLNAMPDLILMIAGDSTIQGVWPAFDWESQLDMTDATGRSTDDFLPSGDATAFRKMLALALETGKTQIDQFYLLAHGENRVRERRIIPSGENEAFLMVRDITEQVKDREALHRAKEAAEAANRTKSAFLANMSHELRTPLNAIIGYSEMLMEIAEEDNQPENVADLGKIQDAGTHLLALINEILDLSKIEAGKVELEVFKFSVPQLIAHTADLVRPLIEKNDNRFEIHCADDVGEMQGDETRVRQILYNLLSNAAKFTESGEVSLTATRKNRDGSDWITFEISDTGIGMDGDQISNLFQEFTQADASTTRKYGGTELGFAISRRFCIMMGGDIEVESTLGVGSTFKVSLQADIGQAVEHGNSARGPARDTPTGGDFEAAADDRLVLVIDDDAGACELFSRYLTGDGFRVITARTGSEGLELAKRENPVVITLDVEMPGKDGWQVLKAFKADPDLADIPIVICSIVDDKSRGYRLGASEFLVKPVDRAKLIDVIGKYACVETCHVLLVEDDPASREMLARTISSVGCRVTEAVNGTTALEALSRVRPSIIILDLMMPGMDGFEFLDALQSRENDRDIPVVVLTARELSPADRQRLEGKIENIVEKPAMRFHELAREIRELECGVPRFRTY